MTIKIKNNEYLLTGTRFYIYTCDGRDYKLWYHDLKDLATGNHIKNINDKRIKKYL